MKTLRLDWNQDRGILISSLNLYLSRLDTSDRRFYAKEHSDHVTTSRQQRTRLERERVLVLLGRLQQMGDF